MNTNKRIAIGLVAALLASMAFAPVGANRISDDIISPGTTNDFCSGADADGIGPIAPVGDSAGCDGNLLPTTQLSLYAGGLLTGCTDAADAAGYTTCAGGFIMSADTVGLTEFGNFRGDWGDEDSVTITNTGDPATGTQATVGYTIRVSYFDGINGGAAPTVLPDVPGVCIPVGGSITVDVGGLDPVDGLAVDAYDPPADSLVAPLTDYTIVGVTGFRTTTGCGSVGLNTAPVVMVGAWGYAYTGVNLAAANIIPDPLWVGPGCLVAWTYSASGPGYFGRARGQAVYNKQLVVDSMNSGLTAPQNSPAVAQAAGGPILLLPGETLNVDAMVWTVGDVRAEDHKAFQCLNTNPGDEPLLNIEPLCAAVGVFDGVSWATSPPVIAKCVNFRAGMLPVVTDCSVAPGSITIVEPVITIRCVVDDTCDLGLPVIALAVGIQLLPPGGVADSRTELYCNDPIAPASTQILDAWTPVPTPLQVAIDNGHKIDAPQWECRFTWTGVNAPAPGIVSLHAGACADQLADI